jgi:hypothetical protein
MATTARAERGLLATLVFVVGAAEARRAAAELAPRLPGGEVYTDDRAPLEWLVDSSLLEYADE